MSETHPRVMIVDDTPANLEMLRQMFRERSYRILTFPRGELAIAAARRSPPDLVLLDINMPGMNGFEVCEAFKNTPSLADVPIIFLSAMTDIDSKIRAFQVGGADFITKPFHSREVLVRVENQLLLASYRERIAHRNQVLSDALAEQQRLRRERDGLMQMIVHDLKNPLGAVLNNCAFVSEAPDVSADVSEAVSDIADATRLLHRRVVTILDVMRSEIRGFELERQIVDLRALVRGACGELARGGPPVAVELPDTEVRVDVDVDVIKRVVENLVDNAVKHGRGEVRVVLRGTRLPELRVIDNGPGISGELGERLFDVYARGGADGHAGHGLGLAFVRLAVEAHGGTVHLDRTDRAAGACFVVQLPGASDDRVA